jgi:hypothetical protein
MKTSLKSLAFLFAPVLLASACGGDLFPPSKDDGGGSNVCVTTPFQLQMGNYTVQEPPAITVQDTCTPPLTANDFKGKQFSVTNNTQTGTITVKSVTSGISLGEGPVTCDKGVLSYSAFLVSSDGNCNYKITDQANFTMVAANTFQFDLTENISDISQVVGKPACTSVKACTTKIFFQANKPVQ